jgi:hypothetical protein
VGILGSFAPHRADAERRVRWTTQNPRPVVVGGWWLGFGSNSSCR